VKAATRFKKKFSGKPIILKLNDNGVFREIRGTLRGLEGNQILLDEGGGLYTRYLLGSQPGRCVPLCVGQEIPAPKMAAVPETGPTESHEFDDDPLNIRLRVLEVQIADLKANSSPLEFKHGKPSRGRGRPPKPVFEDLDVDLDAVCPDGFDMSFLREQIAIHQRGGRPFSFEMAADYLEDLN